MCLPLTDSQLLVLSVHQRGAFDWPFERPDEPVPFFWGRVMNKNAEGNLSP